METNVILSRSADLNVWRQDDQSAPHKPLLVLDARLVAAGQDEVTIAEAEPDLPPCIVSSGRRGSVITPSSRSGGFGAAATLS